MSTHTPGPWEVDEAGSWNNGKRTSTEYFVRRPGDDVAIASDIIEPANNDSPSEANARLIAAAPDLLEAFRVSLIRAYTAGYMHSHEATVEGGFIPVHHSDVTEFHAENIHQMLCDGSLPEASAAIAKATFSQP